MKHLGQLIKNHIETNKLVKKVVAKQVGISPTYLSTIFNAESMDCTLFEKICHVIHLHPALGFDDPISGTAAAARTEADAADTAAAGGEIQTLRELLAEKERTIQVLLATSGIKIGADSDSRR